VVNLFGIENEDSRTCFLVEKLSLSKFLACSESCTVNLLVT
jgi:hypothetical protein